MIEKQEAEVPSPRWRSGSLTVGLALCFGAWPGLAQDVLITPDVHKSCLAAADYTGCVLTQIGKSRLMLGSTTWRRGDGSIVLLDSSSVAIEVIGNDQDRYLRYGYRVIPLQETNALPDFQQRQKHRSLGRRNAIPMPGSDSHEASSGLSHRGFKFQVVLDCRLKKVLYVGVC